MKKLLLSLLFLVFSVSAATAQTQLEMNEKASLDYKKADAELNKVYKKLVSLLDKNEKVLLIQAQKDWIKYRDSHCKFESDPYTGGSIKPLILLTCLEEITKERTKHLKESLKNLNR
ncbi:lysozyme inhibitor LprI family protein [Flavobacterium sp.]|uniref:lysozyme inhibitor LprI family protein n=1 Tax=Flavobacterium sp. TaxID=239 RepID=UPI0026298469|nr:lysozyme inhibitor LprI family protein [Flavobacterium sp.]